MKLSGVLSLLAISTATVNAKALLEPFQGPVTIGKTYEVGWVGDATEHLELLLVHRTSTGWSPVKTLFKDRLSHAGDGKYTWTVDKSDPIGRGYGLWLSSTPIPDKGSFYADLSSWFKIVSAKD